MFSGGGEIGGDFYFLHYCSAFLMSLLIHLFNQNLELLYVSLSFFKSQNIESGMAWFLAVLLSCLSKFQAVGDRGEEAVHATVLRGTEPRLTEPTTWHRGGL